MSTLPGEICIRIISYLEKRDISNCKSVCKAWNKVATSLLENSIRIILADGKLKRLLDDLASYPSFAEKVSKLTVTISDIMDNAMVLQSILNLCPNLLVLKFTETQIQKYFEMLSSPETQLPNVQRIEIKYLANCSKETQQLYIAINYRLSSTITTLVFGNVDDESFNDYSGLVQYLSKFVHLSSLNFWEGIYIDKSLYLDLNEILAVNTSLESLCIRRYGRVYGNLSELPSSMNIHYPTLKKLRLYRCSTDVSLLTYIPSRFINLQELAFANTIIESNVNLVPDEIARETVDDFLFYLVKRHNLFYTYERTSWFKLRTI